MRIWSMLMGRMRDRNQTREQKHHRVMRNCWVFSNLPPPKVTHLNMII